jgi:hypothetical protein
LDVGQINPCGNGYKILTTGLCAPRSSKMFASSDISKYISTEKKQNKNNRLKFSMLILNHEYDKINDNSYLLNKI